MSLAGATMGSAAAVQNSGGLPFAGVISLSGTQLWPGFGINKPGPRTLRSPFLYLGGRNDYRAPLDEAKTIFRNAGSRDKRSVFYLRLAARMDARGRRTIRAKARALILDWIHQHA